MSLFESEIARQQRDGYGPVTLDFDQDGRLVVLEAADRIRVNTDWLRAREALACIVQPDGSLQLDDAGDYRYRSVQDLGDGFCIYERDTIP